MKDRSVRKQRENEESLTKTTRRGADKQQDKFDDDLKVALTTEETKGWPWVVQSIVLYGKVT